MMQRQTFEGKDIRTSSNSVSAHIRKKRIFFFQISLLCFGLFLFENKLIDIEIIVFC